MAERLSANTAARISAAIDAREVFVSREGVSIRNRCEFGIVALDEGMSDDEHLPIALLDRCAFLLDFTAFDFKTPLIPAHTAGADPFVVVVVVVVVVVPPNCPIKVCNCDCKFSI